MRKRSFRPWVAPVTAAVLIAVGSLGWVGTATASPSPQAPATPSFGSSGTDALSSFYQANDASKGWVDLSQTDVSYLRAAQATLSPGLTINNTNAWHGNPVGGWTNTAQTFTWTVDNPTAQQYSIDVLIGNASGTVSVKSQSAAVSKTYATTVSGWDKARFGNLAIPAGRSTITVQDTSGSNLNMSLLSLEIAPTSRIAAIDAAVAAGHGDASWMRTTPLGAFYQWGQWGAYPDGSQKAWPIVYQNADFNALAERARTMGVGYVMWSISWSSYYIGAPIAAVDSVLPGRTTQVDYLGAMIKAFTDRGIRVMFYYHPGHDPDPNPDWWNAFWGVSPNGTWARKEDAIRRWLAIVTEIGNRYKTGLSGWFFDDGGTYYPFPTAMVNAALRAGNPQRIYSFNVQSPANAPRYTDYQDVDFGENNTGWAYPTNSDGTITSGPFAGEQGFGMTLIDQGDWGVRAGDTAPITPSQGQYDLTKYAQHAYLTKQSIALAMRMWNDLSQSRDTVANVTAASDSWQARQLQTTVDDNSPAVTYSGSWQAFDPGTCQEDTCHNSNAAGNTAQFGFTGTGVSLVGILGPDQGQADVYIDGKLDRTIDLSNPVRQVGVPIYRKVNLSNGSHTIKVVTKSSGWVSVDAFTVMTGQTIDDGNASISYSGSWTTLNPGGCEAGTCHNTTAAGSSASLSFSGTGFTWNSVVGPDQGSAQVWVDGKMVRIVNLYNAVRTVGRAVHTSAGLPAGSHTVRIVSTGSGYVTVDSVDIK